MQGQTAQLSPQTIHIGQHYALHQLMVFQQLLQSHQPLPLPAHQPLNLRPQGRTQLDVQLLTECHLLQRHHWQHVLVHELAQTLTAIPAEDCSQVRQVVRHEGIEGMVVLEETQTVLH